MNKTVGKKIKCYFLLIDGENPTQITKKIGCGHSSPKNWFPQLCDKNRRNAPPLEEWQEAIIRAMKPQIKTDAEISEKAKCTEMQVKTFCEREQLTYSPEQIKQLKQRIQTKDEAEISVDIFQRSNGVFQYYGNYERNGDEFKCDIQCVKCGDIKTIKSVTIRHWKRDGTHCIECQKAENQRKAEQEVYKRQCPKCMQSFETMNERKVYCSDKCARAIHDNNKDDRFRKFGVKQNHKITLKAIYERDKGICQICKKPCDRNDFYINENDVFIAGNMYPSKDHKKHLLMADLTHGKTISLHTEYAILSKVTTNNSAE